MNRPTLEEAYGLARQFLKKHSVGILGTQHSFEGQNYPFGAMTPYVVTGTGELLIYISDIALHTNNIKKNNAIGFSIMDVNPKNQQASSRLSFIGKAKILEGTEAEHQGLWEQYLRFYPEAKHYGKAHNFYLCVLSPEQVHFVKTFGQIYTFEGAHILGAALPYESELSGILDHMNQDHQAALVKYCQRYLDRSPSDVSLISIDAEGFHMKADQELVYLNFNQPVQDVMALRQVLVEMARS